jgi:hypothetical protein
MFVYIETERFVRMALSCRHPVSGNLAEASLGRLRRCWRLTKVLSAAIDASGTAAHPQDYLNFYFVSNRKPAPLALNGGHQSQTVFTGGFEPLTVTCNFWARRPRGQVPLRLFPVVPPWTRLFLLQPFTFTCVRHSGGERSYTSTICIGPDLWCAIAGWVV